jgi:hypothetical protein
LGAPSVNQFHFIEGLVLKKTYLTAYTISNMNWILQLCAACVRSVSI